MIGGAKGIGLGIDLGLVNQYNRTGSQSYIEPEVLDSLVGVWSAYGMTNDSPNRSTIKNKLSNKGGDFVISNAAFKLNSGFGKYSADFESFDWAVNISQKQHNKATISLNGRLCNHAAIEVDEMKVNIIGNVTELIYWYIANPDDTTRSEIRLTSGINTLPKSYAKDDGQTYNIGFAYISGDSEITIEQIPSFEDSFVTDGIDDLITSTKTVQEMLGGSTEFTAVSMIHLISPGQDVGGVAYTNYIRTSDNYWTSNRVSNIDKTGIYGYSFKQGTPTVINNILGDKNDYTTEKSDIVSDSSVSDLFKAKFSVEGFEHVINGAVHVSSVAWYWTIIANKVLTTDQINQVIAYFNLDRTLRPDIYCNIAKQGITNENHAEFGDKLIDYSGNGRDIQLNNIAWDGDSGIGKYNYPNWKVTATIANTYSTIVNYPTVNGTYSINVNGVSELMQSIGLHLEIKYTTSTGIIYNDIKQDGVYSYILPDGATDLTLRFGGIPGIVNEPCNITITRIPSHAGALCLDGVNGFGKVTGMPIYKDYTFIIDRQIITNDDSGGIVASKSESATDVTKQGAFMFEYLSSNSISTWSYYKNNSLVASSNSNRNISYQSKYSYNGKGIEIGEAKDSDKLWIGTIRDNDERFANVAIYSLMSFPYSMSKFLIERQLKKHKLGTLYPDMVEFRPVITINGESGDISYANDKWENINIGDYINIGEIVHILLYRKDIEEISNVKVNGAKFQSIDFDSIYNHWNINIELTSKSPQKIDITIDEYIRFEDIAQPYPVLLRFKDENGNEVSWGGKFRVGSTITRIGSFYENNLLDGLYIVRNPRLNGNNLITPTHVVEKSMVFTCDTEYLLDNNEPKCILSPRLLRIPNSSYKILGHIPDISGHGNHGVIHNSAYAGASGANGYLQNFSGWTKASGVSSTDSVISSSNNLVAANGWIAYVTSGTVIPTFKVEISGIPINGNLKFEGSDQVLVNGVNTIQGLTTTKVSGFYISSGYDKDWSNLKIEQIGKYEGAYCFDGVDDFVTIPTVTGGKQVLMKVNWQSIAGTAILYDQRTNGGFAIFNRDYDTNENKVPAYRARNIGGNTYIDGILNEYIYASQLQNITHNIVELYDPELNIGTLNPKIGSSYLNSNYAQMSLYDFMLFDSISTDDKIKELNEYIGIEAKVELPPYYWDAYGKTNLDEDKNYTANLGTVKDVIEVSQPAIFAENWYDGNPEPVLSSPIINQTDYSIEVKANKMDNNFTMMLDVECDTPLPAFKAKFSMVGTAISVDLKYYINGGSKIIDVFKSGGSTEPVILDIPASERSFIYGTNTDNYPNILIEILPADNGTRYGLTNTNFAYDKMSGYGGYNLSRFDKSWSSSSNTSIKVVQRNPYDITLKKLGGNSDWEFNNTELKVISNPVSVKFKSNKNIRVTCDYHYYPVGGNSEGTPLGITSKDLIANKDAIIIISPISQENIDKYNIDVNRGYYLIYFQLSSTLAVNEEVTIEMLPLYPNGLVYDGVTDCSENTNIPAFTDFTAIAKRKRISDKLEGFTVAKGDKIYAEGNGNGFLMEWDTTQQFSFGGKSIIDASKIPDLISYITPTSYNGETITKGTGIDTNSLYVAGNNSVTNYTKMVFYKLILYPKTIPLLQINFLKNLMERDEIIDLNNKIFIQK